MLAEIRDAKDAKKLMDMATAAELYAKKASLGEEAEAYARSIKIDAQTILGEFINQTVESARGKPKPDASGNGAHRGHHTNGIAKALGINKHVQQAARNLAIAKKRAPEVHAGVRNGKISVRKLPKILRPTESPTKQRTIVKTRIYESVIDKAANLPVFNFNELDADLGIYRNNPERRLTPERMHSAGTHLLRIAKAWSEHEKQKATVTKRL